MMVFDVIIVGAGPAGMSAACRLSQSGRSILVLDEQPAPGGQIYRGVETASSSIRKLLGPGYQRGGEVVKRFRQSDVTYLPEASVWLAEADGTVVWSRQGQSHRAKGRRLILATGAQERPCPIEGWTLPGVMTVGAAQIAVKTAGAVAENAVLAGSGPLLLLVAAQYLQLGVPIRALLDTTPAANFIHCLPSALSSLRDPALLAKGLALQRAVRAGNIPLYRRVRALAAHGRGSLEFITFRSGDVWHRLDAVRHLFLHQGVIPNHQLAATLGCQRVWDEHQQAWGLACEANGRTTIPTIFAAGDTTRISGADAAELAGELAAIATLHDFAAMSTTEYRAQSRRLKRRMKQALAARPFVDALFQPSPEARFRLPGEVTVCRCEEVTAADILGYLSGDGHEINEFKSFSRCGMGPCQGRMCGLTVAGMIRHHAPTAVQAAPARARPPVHPVSLAELAHLRLESDGDAQPL